MSGSEERRLVQIASRTAEVNGIAKQINHASKATGVSFDYLMAQAGKESAFDGNAKSSVSSAAGLFQFTKGTWLQLIKLHGAKHGLAAYADGIERTARGDYVVQDPGLRKEILALRKDPALSALIAGEYARDNRRWLEHSLGHKVGSAELYLAHFLGPGGAVKLLKAKAEDPAQAAAELVPEAAAKNRTMFYGADQTPQSVAALYERVRAVMEHPAHPPVRHTPPAALAVAALKYGELPWNPDAASDRPDFDRLLATVPLHHLAHETYAAQVRSASRLTGSLPPRPGEATPAADPVDPLKTIFRELFG